MRFVVHTAKSSIETTPQTGLRKQRVRRGLTLVEMLVATAATLLLVLAVTQSFAVVSEIISVNRSSLEMAGQLRGATLRLQQDFDGITAPVGPWLDSDSGQGYFEYIEGLGSDSIPAMTRLGVTPATVLPPGSHLGDVDDIVMFTARSVEEPFVGTICPIDPNRPNVCIPQTLESDTAEVVWWTVLQDTNRNEARDAGESFKLHRRALLVKPELNVFNTDLGMDLLPELLLARYRPFTPLSLNRFYNENDLSVRPVFHSGMIVGFRANTLADLTLRQNRFAHYPVDLTGANPVFRNLGLPAQYAFAFPFEIDLRPGSPTSLINLVQWGINRGPDNRWGVAGNDDNADGVTDNVGEAGFGDDFRGLQQGHDIILPNVLAFDVRAFDVTAPLSVTEGGEAVLAPGDPGWIYNPDPLAQFGTGAYVDLSYLRNYQSQQILLTLSQFSDIPRSFLDANNNLIKDANEPGLTLPTYDTWPLDYERDGYNQDLDVDANDNSLVDEGTDGIDTNNFGGVDDLTERETRPPYTAPLRGIQVRIRIQDPDSLQIRQQTVVTDL